MKLTLQPPWALAVTDEAIVLSSNITVMPVSLIPKPAPVIVIELPGAAFALLTDMPALVVKVISETLFTEVEEPDASMVWEPAGEAGTTKVAVQPPLALTGIDAGTVGIAVPS